MEGQRKLQRDINMTKIFEKNLVIKKLFCGWNKIHTLHCTVYEFKKNFIHYKLYCNLKYE